MPTYTYLFNEIRLTQVLRSDVDVVFGGNGT
jgi:hypothetical protein